MSTVADRKDTFGLPKSTVKRIIRKASGRKAVSEKLLKAVMKATDEALEMTAHIAHDHMISGKRQTLYGKDVKLAIDSCVGAVTEMGMTKFIKKYDLGKDILSRQATGRLIKAYGAAYIISMDARKVWQVYVTYVIGLKAREIVKKLE